MLKPIKEKSPMKITHLYSGKDNLSYFKDIEIEMPLHKELGLYSPPYDVKNMSFRKFKKGKKFNWHCAPQSQYIIYLEGEVKVTSSSGDFKIFKPGNILFVSDTKGKGHITETLTAGISIIVTTE